MEQFNWRVTRGEIMQMILKREWDAIDATNLPERILTKIPAGTHEIEKIPNPAGYSGNWLVLKGTLIGASEGSWRQWAPGQMNDAPDHENFGKEIDWEEFTVIIID